MKNKIKLKSTLINGLIIAYNENINIDVLLLYFKKWNIWKRHTNKKLKVSFVNNVAPYKNEIKNKNKYFPLFFSLEKI